MKVGDKAAQGGLILTMDVTETKASKPVEVKAVAAS